MVVVARSCFLAALLDVLVVVGAGFPEQPQNHSLPVAEHQSTTMS